MNVRLSAPEGRGLLRDVADAASTVEAEFTCFVRAGSTFTDTEALSRGLKTLLGGNFREDGEDEAETRRLLKRRRKN